MEGSVQTWIQIMLLVISLNSNTIKLKRVIQLFFQASIALFCVQEVIPKHLLDEETRYYLNPCGSFIIGGPQSDAGLTGRKIIVDTYGGWGAHGGGAFSGKDPSKVIFT